MVMRRVTIAVAAFGFVGTVADRAAAQDMFTIPPEPHSLPPEVAPAPNPVASPTGPGANASGVGAPPRGPDTAWLIEPSLGGSIYSIDQGNGSPSESGRSIAGGVGLTRYLPRVVDDDAPLSLQPFLQRASNFGISVSGGGFITDANPVNRTSSNFSGNASVNLYLTRFFIFQGAFAYGYSTVSDSSVHEKTNAVGGNAGLGLRFGDVQVVATYGVQGNDVNGTFQPQRWGPISLSTFMVFGRELTLSANGFAEQGEGGGGASVVYYPSRLFDVYLSGSGLSGGHYNDGITFSEGTGSLGFTYWFVESARIGASYSFSIHHTPTQTVGGLTYGGDEQTHAVNVVAGIHLPS